MSSPNLSEGENISVNAYRQHIFYSLLILFPGNFDY